MMGRKKWILLGCLPVLLALILWILWGNKALMTTEYTAASARLPESFDGFRIAHISDLHNDEFGDGNEALLSLLRQAAPDIIAVTGDLLDSYEPDVEIAASFMEEAVKIAPCYYVAGNHENRKPMEYSALKKRMKACGVTVLEDKAVTLEWGGQQICIVGLMDYKTLSAFYVDSLLPEGSYTILLTHRPEHFGVYAEAGADLVLSGHAHGGQVRLPFLGGLYAPDQGILPEYEDGVHTSGGTTMVVSRGLGNSSFPFRVNNRPELVIVELDCKSNR